jgi:hypothetical protein
MKAGVNVREPVDASLLNSITNRLAGTEPLKHAQGDAEEIETLMKGVDALRRLPIKDIVPPLSFKPVGSDR